VLRDFGLFLLLVLICWYVWQRMGRFRDAPVTRTTDMSRPMSTVIFLDNNIWDFLFERKLDLATELPCPDYRLCLTREAEFEIEPIENESLKAFIQRAIRDCGIETHSYFGFYDESHPPNEQRVGGFNQGYWASKEEIAFIHQQRGRLGSEKKQSTRLYKNEADIGLAARSFHYIVLSLDDKPGPISDAHKQGGHVVFLTDFDQSGMSLSEFIEARKGSW